MGDPHPLLRGLLLCCLAGSALGLVEGRTFDIAMPESALGAYSVARPSLCKMETSVEECDRRDACFTCSNPCSCCTGCTRAAGCHCCNDHSVFHDTCPKATALSYCLWVNPEVDRGKLRSILLFKCYLNVGLEGGMASIMSTKLRSIMLSLRTQHLHVASIFYGWCFGNMHFFA